MKYIGIDGGGTKSEYILMDENGQVLATTLSTATNINSHGVAFVTNSLKEGLLKLKQAVAFKEEEVMICLASAGVDQASDKLPYEKLLSELGYPSPLVINDGEGALSAGTKGKDGIIAIAGTGSVVIGKKDTTLIRAGGWGHVIGDEGSGYAIAIQGIKSVLAAYDGYGQSTLLEQELLKAIEGTVTTDFLTFIYQREFNKDEIAKLAQTVNKAASAGDEVAKKILIEQATLLGQQIIAVKQRLFKSQIVPVVLNGSVAKNSIMYRKQLEKTLAQNGVEHVINLEISAAIGAAYEARKQVKHEGNY